MAGLMSEWTFGDSPAKLQWTSPFPKDVIDNDNHSKHVDVIKEHADRSMVGFIHIWHTMSLALCGSDIIGHPECAGKGPSTMNGFPLLDWEPTPHCSECFRPLCPRCKEILNV